MISSSEVICRYNPKGQGKPLQWFIEGRDFQGKKTRKPCIISGVIVNQEQQQVVAVIAIPRDFPREIRFDADNEGSFPGLWYEDSK